MTLEQAFSVLLTITFGVIVLCGILIRMYLVGGQKSTHKRIDGLDDRVTTLELNRVEEVVQREQILDALERIENSVG